MTEVQQTEQLNPDSYEWETPSKGGAKKVYGDMLNGYTQMGIKVERMKILQKLALGEIDINKYNEEVIKVG